MPRRRRRFAARKSAGEACRFLPGAQAAQDPVRPVPEGPQCCRPRTSREIEDQIQIADHEGEAAPGEVYERARALYFWTTRKQGQAGVMSCRSFPLLCYPGLKDPASRLPADGALFRFRMLAGP